MGWARAFIEPEPAQAKPKPGLSEPSPARASLSMTLPLARDLARYGIRIRRFTATPC
ncbi:hypothetical protein JB92DRAFT_2867314 [Gautieria morchelliformis]|nr:hypothetical protein JB92DRAFT_2867314 [Gautieria morchelliformis]